MATGAQAGAGAALTGGEPGFHRRVLVVPRPEAVSAWVEDDYHHMGVTLHHDGVTIGRVEAEMVRVPWTTCPGATAQLAATFTGAVLAEAGRRGEKPLNCTHLHDIAVLAAAHAHDNVPTRYAILVTDAANGVRIAELARDGAPLLRLVERDGRIEWPEAAAGRTLFDLGEWIASLDGAGREAARLLRWAAIIAHGRAIPMDRQSDAGRMPPNCFTFQSPRREVARRIGRIVDFSGSAARPLDAPPGSAAQA